MWRHVLFAVCTHRRRIHADVIPAQVIDHIDDVVGLKSTRRTAHQAHSCIESPLEIKVSSKALLQLADWCRQQQAASTHPEQGGSSCSPASPPPRPTIDPQRAATAVPLEQLWTRLPQTKRHELLVQLSQILAQRLTPPMDKEETDE